MYEVYWGLNARLVDTERLRDLQAFHEELDSEKEFDTDLFRNIAYLTEEVGEVVQAARALKRASESNDIERARAHVGEELADCLAYILKLANYAEVDLQSAYLTKMEKNLDRSWRTDEASE